MDLFVVTGLLVFSSYVRGYSPQNNSLSGLSTSQSREIPPSITTVDFSDTSSFPTFEGIDEGDKNTESRSQQHSNVAWQPDSQSAPTSPEISSDNILLSRLSKMTENLQKTRKNYEGYKENLPREDSDGNQSLIRREITNLWIPVEEVPDNSAVGNYYVYQPQFLRNLQNEYGDYPSSEGVDDKNGTAPKVYQDSGYPTIGHEPQYYQKNYFYNYYPMLSRRPLVPPKWSSKPEEANHMEDRKKGRGSYNRKLVNQNSCRQYLEFLKYAFEKLEEHPDYTYDYGGDEQYAGKLPVGGQNIFSTQMTGPTLYIDNSGNIAQVNSKENIIQNYDSFVPNSPFKPGQDFRPSLPGSLQISSGDRNSPSTPGMTPSTVGSDNIILHYNEPTTENWSRTTSKISTTNSNLRSNIISETMFTSPYSTSPKLDDEFKYNYPEAKTTTAEVPGTYWPSSDSYYNTLGNFGERTTDHPILAYGFSNGTGSPNWSITTPPQTPTKILIPYPTEVPDYNISDDVPRSKDVDCDDKMLPCPDTVNVTYPLNGYCNKYVSCEAGRATRRTCPDGLHFNIITKSCDLPHNSFCTYFCPSPNGYYGIPGDCGGYFVCKNSVPEYRMCPPHMHWDVEKRSCTFLEFSNCPMKCTSGNEVKHYEGDCRAYVICLNRIAYYHRCPPNMRFDKLTLTCIPENQSKCEDDTRLLTKNVNPSAVCRDIEVKVGTKIWCNFFEANKQRIYIP